jgi:isochorismate synthase
MRPEAARQARGHRYTVERVGGARDLLELVDGRPPREPLFYWARPQADCEMLALGVVDAVEASGRDRFGRVSREGAALLAAMVPTDHTSVRGAPSPRLLGGFAFADEPVRSTAWREFPACRMVLPGELWLREGEATWLIRVVSGHRATASSPSCPDGPVLELVAGDDQGRAAWVARVNEALRLVGEGSVSKVVLSRHRAVDVRSLPPISTLVGRLRAGRPGCFTYWVRNATTDFFGSSPELLARVSGQRVETEAVAGTAARGLTPADDFERARALVLSDKNRREHRVVIAAIQEALGPVTSKLEVGGDVDVRSVPEAHHLHTAVSGRLARPTGVLEVAGLLHPTPAVCGTPRRAARAIIEAAEPERGWYTGGVGWMNGTGDGELAVALRGALVDGSRMIVPAGAGIVAGSDPDAEFDETDLKMRGLQLALEGAAT